jgi:hypothetical protein
MRWNRTENAKNGIALLDSPQVFVSYTSTRFLSTLGLPLRVALKSSRLFPSQSRKLRSRVRPRPTEGHGAPDAVARASPPKISPLRAAKLSSIGNTTGLRTFPSIDITHPALRSESRLLTPTRPNPFPSNGQPGTSQLATSTSPFDEGLGPIASTHDGLSLFLLLTPSPCHKISAS